MKTEEILNAREKTHGDFEEVGKTTEALTSIITESHSENRKITDAQILALKMIALKMARIMRGDPNFADHWDDIAGYAMLGKGKRIGCGRCGKYRRDKLSRCECMEGERVIRQEDMPQTTHVGEKFLFEEGRFGPVDEKQWFKTEPCQHPSRNKIKRFHTEIKDEVSYLLTTADCLECGHVHILDAVTKEEKEDISKTEITE